MGYILGISGFLLLIGSTCLTGSTLGQVVLLACIGLALMLAGKLWKPVKAIIKAGIGGKVKCHLRPKNWKRSARLMKRWSASG